MIYFIFAALGVLALSQTKQAQTVIQSVQDSVDSDWTKFDLLFQHYAAQNNVDWKILKAICLNESDLGNERSVAYGILNPSDIDGSKSSDGKSWGIMQMTIPTARDFDSEITPEDLNNPEISIDLASQFLRSLYRQFPISDIRRTEWIVKSYNQGAGNTKKEQRGDISGYAKAYWERFQRNYERVTA